MKGKRQKTKKVTAVRRRKAAVPAFTLRDAWDIAVVATLLAIIVYFSTIVRNNQHLVAAWFAIENVNITGNTDTVDHEALKAIIRKHSAHGFLRIQMRPLEAALEQLAWVREASVRRDWPDTLRVRIAQHIPIARWGDAGLMNTHGGLFFPDDIGPYQALPLLFGERARATALAKIFETSMHQLKSAGLQLRGLYENERHSKHIVLANGFILAIGENDISEKMERFITAYRQFLVTNSTEIKKIDLRYPNGLAIEWRNSQIAQHLSEGLAQAMTVHSTESGL